MESINNSNQRMWDLIRFCRQELFMEDLITLDEFYDLANDHPAVARIVDYDEKYAEFKKAINETTGS